MMFHLNLIKTCTKYRFTQSPRNRSGQRQRSKKKRKNTTETNDREMNRKRTESYSKVSLNGIKSMKKNQGMPFSVYPQGV